MWRFYSSFHELRIAACESVTWRPNSPLSWLAGGLEEMVSVCMLTQVAKSTFVLRQREKKVTEQLESQRFNDICTFFILWTVTQVLEACVKNCGHRFHVLVASQEFVEGVLVRSILPKYNPPTALHDRVLSLIQVCGCSHTGQYDRNCMN